jgi:hypothetical protein
MRKFVTVALVVFAVVAATAPLLAPAAKAPAKSCSSCGGTTPVCCMGCSGTFAYCARSYALCPECPVP